MPGNQNNNGNGNNNNGHGPKDYSVATADGKMLARGVDGAFIPADPNNRDYQDYLAWVAAGNAPTPFAAPVVANTSVAARDFVGRLTNAEYLAIATALRDPDLLLRLLTAMGVTQIDPTDPRLAAAINIFTFAGVLNAARKAAILAPGSGTP